MTWKKWTLFCFTIGALAHLIVAPGILIVLHLPFYQKVTPHARLDNIDLVQVVTLLTWGSYWIVILAVMGMLSIAERCQRSILKRFTGSL